MVVSLEIRVKMHSLGDYYGRKRRKCRKGSEEEKDRMGTALRLMSGSCRKLKFFISDKTGSDILSLRLITS